MSEPIKQRQDWLTRFCSSRGLPAAYQQAAADQLWPLAQWLAQRQADAGRCLVVGINGSQGSGKSTLVTVLAAFLRILQRRAVCLSIDDLYLTREQRLALSRSVHPLLRTRGVPGTHDPRLGLDCLRALAALDSKASYRLPAFDKAQDDRLPESAWPRVDGSVDLVLFEGWCVGTPPQTEQALEVPINELERNEDRDGRWRHWVNQQLAGPYAELFSRLDLQLFLQAPDMDCVLAWRRQQEADTRAQAGTVETRTMSDEELIRFVQHYERLTRHALLTMPDRADSCIELDRHHAIVDVRYR